MNRCASLPFKSPMWLAAALLTCCLTLSASPAFAAADLPKIAVYATGGKDADENRIFATLTLKALIKSGKYAAAERPDEFAAQIDRERAAQHNDTPDDAEISRLGIQAGVRYVCVVNIARAFDEALISARVIDVETAMAATTGSVDCRLGPAGVIQKVVNELVGKMVGVQVGKTVRKEPKVNARKHAAGVRLGAFVGNVADMNINICGRLGLNDNSRVTAIMGLNAYIYEYKDCEYWFNSYLGLEMAGFYEWHNGGKPIRWYAGPGGALFLFYSNTTGFGSLGLGGRGGVEFNGKSGLFAGFDLRPTYYIPLDSPSRLKELRVLPALTLGYAF